MATTDNLKDYVVTKYAGAKVAGVPAKAGATVQLTEAAARAELLAGAIVEPSKDDKAKAADPMEGSDKLKDIRARAVGLDEAPAEPEIDKPAAPQKAAASAKADAPAGNGAN